MELLRKAIFWRRRSDTQSPVRFTIGSLDLHSSNRVSTTKYSVITFFPMFFYQEFKSFANVFFLFICILQTVGFSPVRANTTIMPLTFILFFAAIKEIYEDFWRKINDRKVNHQLTTAFVPNENGTWAWKKVPWSKIKTGQVVKVMRGEEIPADLVILSSSEPAGMAYIETSNLDGESNLKIRQSLPCTAIATSESAIQALIDSRTVVDCNPPCAAIYEFKGALSIRKRFFSGQRSDDFSEDEHTVFPLDTSQLLPRGCRLQNTEWIFGVIAYSGKLTKLMLNATRTSTKGSKVDKQLNYQIMILFGVLVTITIYTACRYVVNIDEKNYYLGYYNCSFPISCLGERRLHIVGTLLSLLVLYSSLIPISIYISLEMIGLFQASFIRQDLGLYDEKTDTRAEVKSSCLNSQLGQVVHIVSDKTGTLTQNKMCFKMCSVGGKLYGNPAAERFDGSPLLEMMRSPLMSDHKQDVREFLTLLAICHTVVLEQRQAEGKEELLYHASSPDEMALVQCAKDMEFVFSARTPLSISVEALGKEEKFELLNILEFTSNRRRMSVIVKSADGKIKLYIKGADSVILPRLAPDSDRKKLFETITHLEQFANYGYRTLCLAMAELSEKQYKEWEPDFNKACVAIEGREQLIAEKAELIEQNLYLLGATGIEDKLQEGAKETIAQIYKGGMAVWVLTGDKLETAQNIGYSCGLIQQDMNILIIAEDTAELTELRIKSYLNDILSSHGGRIALVVSGQSLTFALRPPISSEFFQLTSLSSAVIFCRCSPMQKAAVVRFIQKYSDGCVLAVGDGANDVAMIQAADVGVGISGEEGLQAAIAADYSIAQFRFLSRLLFVHGAVSYHRITKSILYYFYKAACHTTIMFLYSLYTLSSETTMFDAWSMVMYNIYFTSWPPLAIGIWDRLFDFDIMLRYPALYQLSQKGDTFNLKKFCEWVFFGILHAVLLFFMGLHTFKDGVLWSHGRNGNIFAMGTAIDIATVLTVNMKFLIETDSLTIMSVVAFIGSLAMMMIYFFSTSLTTPFSPVIRLEPEMADVILDIFTSPTVLLFILFSSVTAVSFDMLLKIYRRSVKRTVYEEVVSKELASGQKFDLLHRPLTKVRNFVSRTSESALNLVTFNHRGFAFSQDDGRTISQRELIRIYDSRMSKLNPFDLTQSVVKTESERGISKIFMDAEKDPKPNLNATPRTPETPPTPIITWLSCS